MNRRVVGLAAAIALAPLYQSASAEEACQAIVEGLAALDMTKGAELVASGPNKTYKALYDECDLHDTFNGKPLPPKRRCSTDKNQVAYVKKFPDGTVVFEAKMAVDADGSPAAVGDAAGQAETWLTFDAGSNDKFVNAEEVPFVVIPLVSSAYGVSFRGDTGIGKGDLAVVIRGDKCSLGVVGDAGPPFRLGEASIRTNEDLGNPQCATAGQHPCMLLKGGGSGVGVASGVTYILFPHTRPKPLLSQTVVSVAAEQASARAAKFFEQFGH